MNLDLRQGIETVEEAGPLVNAVTNEVTVNDVAQVIRHWGGFPVMSDDEREVGDMVAGAQACLLNMGTVSETGESTMLSAGRSANENDVPVVLDPVGAGATPTRTRVATRLATELDVSIIKGNYGEVSVLAGEDAEVRGVESAGEYSDIAATAVSCAQRHDAVVVASGETDVVATPEGAYEVAAGHPKMGDVVGTGCMLGGSLATLAGALEDMEEAALLGTVGFGLAGELAAGEAFGPVRGPASYNVAFKDSIAGLRDADYDEPASRVSQVLTIEH
ncbi:MAG: hydroxyethylthiazole kinase [Halodesulfurarchaeum sp.]